jgi:hypothetical protein
MKMSIEIDVDATEAQRPHITDEVEGHLLAALHVLQDSGLDPTMTVVTDDTPIHLAAAKAEGAAA